MSSKDARGLELESINSWSDLLADGDPVVTLIENVVRPGAFVGSSQLRV